MTENTITDFYWSYSHICKYRISFSIECTLYNVTCTNKVTSIQNNFSIYENEGNNIFKQVESFVVKISLEILLLDNIYITLMFNTYTNLQFSFYISMQQGIK